MNKNINNWWEQFKLRNLRKDVFDTWLASSLLLRKLQEYITDIDKARNKVPDKVQPYFEGYKNELLAFFDQYNSNNCSNDLKKLVEEWDTEDLRLSLKVLGEIRLQFGIVTVQIGASSQGFF